MQKKYNTEHLIFSNSQIFRNTVQEREDIFRPRKLEKIIGNDRISKN